MLVISTKQLGEPDWADGMPWYPITGILVEVAGWKHTLYALTFVPATMRIYTRAVIQPYNPDFTKKYGLGGERVAVGVHGESSTVIIAGHIFVVDKAKRDRAYDLRFRWIDPNGKGHASES